MTQTKKRILVTGGAGYVGSHVCKALAGAGLEPICLDNFSTGHRHLVKWGPTLEVDLCDESSLGRAIAGLDIGAAIHLAARIDIAESIRDPLGYFALNVGGTINLLRALKARKEHVPIIFSSSAAIYGDADVAKFSESAPLLPTTPYGSGKRMIEEILSFLWRRYEWPSISLRYFNVAGADPDGETGETHDPETHLIPLLLAAAADPSATFQLFGNDYATEDGTCIRDYVHVADVANAHVLALESLLANPRSEALNIGYGRGFSVREIMNAVERVTGKTIRHQLSPRRAGDPARLVADARNAATSIGWEPRFADNLDAIVAHAWKWQQRQLTLR